MICVNFYGGAGIGKSTLAAMVFAELKIKGIRTDLVGEFAKEVVYDRAYDILADQQYLFSQQAHRLFRMKNYGVQVAVCDSPLLLNLAYNQDPNNGRFNELVVEAYEQYDNMDYLLGREEEFWKKDKRSGNIARAIEMDKKIQAMLDCYDIQPIKVSPMDRELASRIASDVEKKVNTQEWLEKKRPFADEPWKVVSK